MNVLVRKSIRWIALVLIAIPLLIGAGCKSKKKAMEAAAAAEKARIEQEAALAKEKAAEEEARRKREEEERARREAEARAKANDPYNKLSNYFSAIANSSSVASANSSINEALGLFASKDAPVLIVISEENGQKDYDRPTTISNYLQYLKDQKKSMNKIGQLQFDSSGKITEVELIKE